MFIVVMFAVFPGCSESPKVREFKDSVRALVKEGRAGLKMLETGSTIEDLDKQRDKLNDLDAHVPDVPSELDSTGDLAKQIENVSRSFMFARSFTNLHDDAKKNTVDQELIAKTKANVDETVAELKAALDAIEAKLGL